MYTTPSEARTVLMGVYKDMANENLYSYHLSLLFTISIGHRPVRRQFEHFVPRNPDQFA